MTIGYKPKGSAAAPNEFDYYAAALWNAYKCSSLRDFAKPFFA
jgi:hypothetical protein